MQRSGILMQPRPIEGLGIAIRDGYGTGFVLFMAAGLWRGAAALELVQHGVEWNLGMFEAHADLQLVAGTNTSALAFSAALGAAAHGLHLLDPDQAALWTM